MTAAVLCTAGSKSASRKRSAMRICSRPV
jgi:hypothetical protein